jgi:hypothetical protein
MTNDFLKEYKTKFTVGDSVVFCHNNMLFRGKVDVAILSTTYKEDVILYWVSSGGVQFKKREDELISELEYLHPDIGLKEIKPDAKISNFNKAVPFLWPDIEEEPQTQFEAIGGAQYSIFGDDINTNMIHLEISPDWVWSKNDLYELVDHLLDVIDDLE